MIAHICLKFLPLKEQKKFLLFLAEKAERERELQLQQNKKEIDRFYEEPYF